MFRGLLSILITLVVLEIKIGNAQDEFSAHRIGDDIMLGVGSSAYQIEGAWNYGDKSGNIWDVLTRDFPENVINGTGEVAADSFNKIDQDVALLKEIGVDLYRFSISWSRLLPNGYSNVVSETGLQYYNALIDALVEADIVPMVVLYHWDLPQILQNLGGWANSEMVNVFGDYADVAYRNFGDRVKYWITFSSPSVFCQGYGSTNFAPANVYYQTGIGEYLCINTVLRAHARAYHVYDDNYRVAQNGSVGIALSVNWYEPDSSSSLDIRAALRALDFEVGVFAHPIFKNQGDYPESVKSTVARRSSAEGFPYSRLPELTLEQIEYIRGSADFFGVNHYTAYIVGDGPSLYDRNPEFILDRELSEWQPSLSWEETATPSFAVTPWAFTKALLWLQAEYGGSYGIPFFITENGYSDYGDVDDQSRINFIKRYVSGLLEAIIQGVSVGAYTYWGFLDGFEWLNGYESKFGLVHVNFTDPERSRTLKSSAAFYKELIVERSLVLNGSSISTNSTNPVEESTVPGTVPATVETTTDLPVTENTNGAKLKAVNYQFVPIYLIFMIISCFTGNW